MLLRAIVGAAMAQGGRLAEPGEFTFRAYLSGRIDLVQAEAVRDLIDAVTPLQARAAFDQLEGTLTDRIREIDARLFDLTARLEASLDFPEEGYHFVDRGEAARELDAIAAMLSASARDRGARPADPRGPARRDRRPAERGQVEPVQPARRRGPRHRRRPARDDARSADRDDRRRRRADDDRRHRRRAQPARATPSKPKGIARARRGA